MPPIVLIDATKGVLRQSRRHAFIASLLGVQHIIAAVNKMDLVGFSQEVFDRIAAEFREFADAARYQQSLRRTRQRARRRQRRAAQQAHALVRGPGAARISRNACAVSGDAASGPLRFPVQYVIRPDASFRGFAGQIASGELRAGNERRWRCLRGVKTRVKSIVAFEDELESRAPGRFRHDHARRRNRPQPRRHARCRDRCAVRRHRVPRHARLDARRAARPAQDLRA